MHLTDTQDGKALRRVVVVGGGIGGAEAALTMAIGLADAEVTMVSRWPSIRLLPDLVYVPFGVSARRIDVPISALAPHGVQSVAAEVERVDCSAKTLETSAGTIHFDVLVAAPGAQPRAGYERNLRTLDDANRLRRDLSNLVNEAARGAQRTITIRSEAESSWSAPAVELALLLGAWIRSRGLEDRIEILLVTSDSSVFEWFGPDAEGVVDAALGRARVKVATGVPAGEFDDLGGDVVVDFGNMHPRIIDGLSGLGVSGWYEPSDLNFEVAPGVHVIGDAINLPFRAGFATAWQARRVLDHLGGSTASLGREIDGIPTEAVEYQMDLADSVLRARISLADTLARPFLGHDAEIAVDAGGRPDKLAGLLLHDRVLRWGEALHDAPLAYRDVLIADQEGIASA